MKTATKKQPTAKPKPCGCIAAVNKAIAIHNAKLSTRLQINFKTGKGSLCLGVPAEKIDSKIRKPLPFFACTYCPFCGLKLEGKSK